MRNCLFSPPVLLYYNGSPDSSFSWRMTRLIRYPDRERYLCNPFLFFSTFFRLFHLNSSTHRLPRFPQRNLCSHVIAATDTAYYHAHISLGLAELRILPAAFADTAHLILNCLATDSGPRRGELPSFWSSMVFRHAPTPWKGSGNNNKRLQGTG